METLRCIGTTNKDGDTELHVLFDTKFARVLFENGSTVEDVVDQLRILADNIESTIV